MGFPTKVQVIQRKESQQWYINLPSAVAQAMEFQRGEIVEWIIEDRAHMILVRPAPPSPIGKKKVNPESSQALTRSGKKPPAPSASGGLGNAPGR